MKKIVCGAIATILAAGLLTGCGGEKDLPLAKLDVDKYVTLCDYNSLSVSVPQPEVDEEELVQTMLGVYSRSISADNGGIMDRVVDVGDTVNIDYVGKLDGVPFGGGTAAGDILTIGSGRFIDGFEDGLIGVTPGETVDLEMAFPDPYPNNPNLSGQAVVFTVTVNCIFPVLESIEDMKDEVVPYIGIEGVSTVEEFRQYTYDYLYAKAQNDYVSDLQGAIMQELLAQCEFQTLPENLLEESRKTLTENLQTAAAQVGMTVDELAYYNGTTVEGFLETYAPDGVKQNLILQAIANKEGLAVDDEELQSQLEEYAFNGGYASVEEFVEDIPMEDFRNYFMSLKVIEFLKERVQVN